MNNLNQRILNGAILTASLNGGFLRRVTIGPEGAGQTIVEDATLDLALLRADGRTKMLPPPKDGLPVDSSWADWLLLHGYSLRATKGKHRNTVHVDLLRESQYAERGPMAHFPRKVSGYGAGIVEALVVAFAGCAEEFVDVKAALPVTVE